MFELILISLFVFGMVLGQGAYTLTRVYEGKKLSSPYHCLSCGYFNGFLSFFKFLFKKNQCKKCLRKKDPWLPIIEFFMGFLFFITFLVMPFRWFSIEVCLFIFMSLTACVVDIKRTILPDTLTLGGILVAVLGAFFNPERSVMDSIIGVVLGGGLILIPSYLFYLIKKVEGMGGGDVKMLAWIGALIGFKSIVYVLFLSCLLATAFGVLFYIKKGIKGSKHSFMKFELAFGPYLAFSTYLYIFFSKLF